MIHNQPNYSIEVWPLGLVICSVNYQKGVPLAALSEVVPMAPKGSVIDPGIGHHLKESGVSRAVFVVVTKKHGKEWRELIEKQLAAAPISPELKWWNGVHVGKSSASIFAVFCMSSLAGRAKEYGEGSVPADADDFGRCARLLKAFPEWRSQLNRVTEAYPDSKWPAIIAKWGQLETSSAAVQTAALRSEP